MMKTYRVENGAGVELRTIALNTHFAIVGVLASVLIALSGVVIAQSSYGNGRVDGAETIARTIVDKIDRNREALNSLSANQTILTDKLGIITTALDQHIIATAPQADKIADLTRKVDRLTDRVAQYYGRAPRIEDHD